MTISVAQLRADLVAGCPGVTPIPRAALQRGLTNAETAHLSASDRAALAECGVTIRGIDEIVRRQAQGLEKTSTR